MWLKYRLGFFVRSIKQEKLSKMRDDMGWAEVKHFEKSKQEGKIYGYKEYAWK